MPEPCKIITFTFLSLSKRLKTFIKSFKFLKDNALYVFGSFNVTIVIPLIKFLTTTLFKEILKKTGQVCIQIRDVQGVDDNPFDFETVKKNIEDKLNPEFEGRFQIMLVPNITNICYGRGVGYKIEEIVLSEEIQKISATKIRAKMRAEGKLK